MVLTVSSPVTARTLSAEDSTRLLIEAAGANASVTLYSEDEARSRILSGVITGVTSSHLEINILELDRTALTARASSTLRAQVTHADSRYRFRTQCVESDAAAEIDVLRVLKPARIVMVERRRSRRCHLRAQAEITLHDTNDAGAWSCSATMLNLSIGGLACRVRRRDAESMAVGQTLQASFRVGSPLEEFQMTSRVVSTTQAGTPGHMVVGMEFVADQHNREAWERLQGVLRYSPSDSGQDNGL